MGDYEGGACAAIYLAWPQRAVGPDARDCGVNESRLLMQMHLQPDVTENSLDFRTFGAGASIRQPFIRLL